jgi:hypothetical protein
MNSERVQPTALHLRFSFFQSLFALIFQVRNSLYCAVPHAELVWLCQTQASVDWNLGDHGLVSWSRRDVRTLTIALLFCGGPNPFHPPILTGPPPTFIGTSRTFAETLHIHIHIRI